MTRARLLKTRGRCRHLIRARMAGADAPPSAAAQYESQLIRDRGVYNCLGGSSQPLTPHYSRAAPVHPSMPIVADPVVTYQACRVEPLRSTGQWCWTTGSCQCPLEGIQADLPWTAGLCSAAPRLDRPKNHSRPESMPREGFTRTASWDSGRNDLRS